MNVNQNKEAKKNLKNKSIKQKCPSTKCEGISSNYPVNKNSDCTKIISCKQQEKINPVEIEDKELFADKKFKQKEYEDAIIQYDLIIMQNPLNFQAIVNRTLCQQQTQNYIEAIHFYSEALSHINLIRNIQLRNKWYYKLVKRRGMCYMHQNMFREALQDFKVCMIYYQNQDSQFGKIIKNMERCKAQLEREESSEDF